VSELLDAARDLFGPACVLQFEDFNSNDAFPLLSTERSRHLTYNDDIQGTAAVCVAAVLGALRLRVPDAESLVAEMRDTVVLFHGAGSANLGTASLMMTEAGVPAGNIFMTNSRGLLWKESEDGSGEDGLLGGNPSNNKQKSGDGARVGPLGGNFRKDEPKRGDGIGGKEGPPGGISRNNEQQRGDGSGQGLPVGNFRNDEQKRVARWGKPSWDSTDLVETIRRIKPDVLVGAVGTLPGCFSRAVVEAMVEVQAEKAAAAKQCGWLDRRIQRQFRPTIFALSNPNTQAEITAQDCYAFSRGRAIFGSGTRFAPLEVDSRERRPGQVNNFFIFPGLSFGLMACAAKTVPESLFLAAAEAGAPRVRRLEYCRCPSRALFKGLKPQPNAATDPPLKVPS
jgi:malic enzyme